MDKTNRLKTIVSTALFAALTIFSVAVTIQFNNILMDPRNIAFAADFLATGNSISHFKLTVSINGNGSVTKSPDKTDYNKNEVVSVSAQPDSKWNFMNWSGDIDSADPKNNPLSVVMNRNRSVVATFASEDHYQLNVKIEGKGTVDINPEKPVYNKDDTVELFADPEPGWSFLCWKGDTDSGAVSDDYLAVVMSKNRTITAIFKPIDIYVYYDSRETVIDENYGDNYGECSFVTFVAQKEKMMPDGTTVSVLYDDDEPIDVGFIGQPPAPNGPFTGSIGGIYGMNDVTDFVSFTNPGQNGANFLSSNWKGFYYVLGKAGIPSAETAIASLSSGACSDQKSGVGLALCGGHNPAVVLVKDWFWCETPVDITAKAIDQDGKTIKTVAIRTNVDNVSLTREKIGLGGAMRIPKAGTHYADDPGKFVINNTIVDNKGRVYADIMDILVDAESGNGQWPDTGEGPDWLQVAAADIYNSATDVTNCVWMIIATGGNFGGQASWILPYQVKLNPYTYTMRFNKSSGSYASFFMDRARDGTIYHEALHCYHMLPGAYVDDEENSNRRYNDYLYVDHSGGGQNAYLKFSYDSREMGFLKRNSKYNYFSSYIDGWLNGTDGDKDQYPDPKSTNFITSIGFTDEQISEIFEDAGEVTLTAETDIPSCLPDGSAFDITGYNDGNLFSIYIYKPAGTFSSSKEKWIQQNSGSPWISIEKGNSETFQGGNGQYTHSPYTFKIRGYNGHVVSPSIEDIPQYIKQGYTKFYIRYGFRYKEYPYEYDASYFETTN